MRRGSPPPPLPRDPGHCTFAPSHVTCIFATTAECQLFPRPVALQGRDHPDTFVQPGLCLCGLQTQKDVQADGCAVLYYHRRGGNVDKCTRNINIFVQPSYTLNPYHCFLLSASTEIIISVPIPGLRTWGIPQ